MRDLEISEKGSSTYLDGDVHDLRVKCVVLVVNIDSKSLAALVVHFAVDAEALYTN